jgi:hypothetical protein
MLKAIEILSWIITILTGINNLLKKGEHHYNKAYVNIY